MEGSIKLCGLSTVEDDNFVVFTDVVLDSEHVELWGQCREDCLEFAKP